MTTGREAGGNARPSGSSPRYSEQVAGHFPSQNEYNSQPSKHTFHPAKIIKTSLLAATFKKRSIYYIQH